MSTSTPSCPKCNRKIMQSISNRCMYCGADLPVEHHLTQEEKNRLLTEKLEQFRQTEENADAIINDMRKGFGLPGKKSRKQKKITNAQALTDALADINDQMEALKKKRNSDN